MSQDVYRKLAERLDAIPNGFPATESGVEFKLLAKMFDPQEAALASVMRLTREPAADIAARAGIDARQARRTLKDMARKGLIQAGRSDRKLVFGLMPFAVGIYEAQLPRLDAEMAALFEQYYQETQGGLARDVPALHRVIPVGEAISFDLEIYSHEQATQLVQQAKSWSVRDCICRVQQKLVGKGCDHPLESCLSFAPVEGAFDNSDVARAITKEEALQVLREAQEAGLVHTVGNYRDEHYYICNCCTCCCGILRGVAEFGMPTAVAKSDFFAVVDGDLCIGCGSCVEVCPFKALSVPEDTVQVDYGRCMGCGLCVPDCPVGALHLQRRPEEELPPTPADFDRWLEQRARERGVEMDEIR